MIRVCLSPDRSYLHQKNLRLAGLSRPRDTTRVQPVTLLGPSRKNGVRIGSGRKEKRQKRQAHSKSFAIFKGLRSSRQRRGVRLCLLRGRGRTPSPLRCEKL